MCRTVSMGGTSGLHVAQRRHRNKPCRRRDVLLVVARVARAALQMDCDISRHSLLLGRAHFACSLPAAPAAGRAVFAVVCMSSFVGSHGFLEQLARKREREREKSPRQRWQPNQPSIRGIGLVHVLPLRWYCYWHGCSLCCDYSHRHLYSYWGWYCYWYWYWYWYWHRDRGSVVVHCHCLGTHALAMAMRQNSVWFGYWCWYWYCGSGASALVRVLCHAEVLSFRVVRGQPRKPRYSPPRSQDICRRPSATRTARRRCGPPSPWPHAPRPGLFVARPHRRAACRGARALRRARAASSRRAPGTRPRPRGACLRRLPCGMRQGGSLSRSLADRGEDEAHQRRHTLAEGGPYSANRGQIWPCHFWPKRGGFVELRPDLVRFRSSLLRAALGKWHPDGRSG